MRCAAVWPCSCFQRVAPSCLAGREPTQPGCGAKKHSARTPALSLAAAAAHDAPPRLTNTPPPYLHLCLQTLISKDDFEEHLEGNEEMWEDMEGGVREALDSAKEFLALAKQKTKPEVVMLREG